MVLFFSQKTITNLKQWVYSNRVEIWWGNIKNI